MTATEWVNGFLSHALFRYLKIKADEVECASVFAGWFIFNAEWSDEKGRQNDVYSIHNIFEMSFITFCFDFFLLNLINRNNLLLFYVVTIKKCESFFSLNVDHKIKKRTMKFVRGRWFDLIMSSFWSVHVL